MFKVKSLMFNVLLSISSAVLLILCFPKPDFSFFAWIALVPWFFALHRQRPLRAFFLSYLVGVLFFSATLYWITYTSGLGFTLLVFYLGVFFAVFGLLFSISYKSHTITRLIVIPCIWVSLEYIRSHLFSGFGWGLLGYSQYLTLPVIQISDITGAYGVSFLLVLVNVGIFQAASFRLQASGCKLQASGFRLQAASFKFAPIAFILFVLISVLGYGYFRLSYRGEGENIKIAVIQGNIAQEKKWDPQFRNYILERYFRLTEESALNYPDLIIWPETAVPGYLETESALLEELISLSQKVYPAHLLVGTPLFRKDAGIYNSAVLLFQGRIIKRYDKLHLVPFGEFVPFPQIFSHFPFASLIANFTSGQDYTVFQLSGEPQATFSALICFEDIFPHLARRFVQKGAQVLVNMTNDAWFKDSAEPYQHLQASVFRAVENRVNVVRSANTGISCFINPWGKILSRVSDELGRDLLVTGERVETLKLVSMPSYYSAFGDIFAWLCLILGSFALCYRHIFF